MILCDGPRKQEYRNPRTPLANQDEPLNQLGCWDS